MVLIVQTETLGRTGFETYVAERLSENSTISIMDRIRKLNVSKFSCIRKSVTISTDLETKKQKLTVSFFGRCATLSSSDRGINFKEILGHHDLHPTPASFMEDDGYLIPRSDGKSKLMLEVGKDLRVHFLIANENSCHILDAMYIVNKMEPKTQFVKRGSELAAIFTSLSMK